MARACWRVGAHPRSWRLWAHPPRVVTYFLAWFFVAVACAIVAVTMFPTPSGIDWARFAILVACVTTHLSLTRRPEEAIRSRNPTPHVDVTTMWTYAAVLVLPPYIAMIFVILVLGQRWFIARRPLHRQIASSSMVVAAVLFSRVVLDAAGMDGMKAPGWLASSDQILVAAVGGIVYAGSQAVIVAGAIALIEGKSTVPGLLGSGYENALELFGIGLGIVTAILTVNVPLALVVMIPVAVVLNYVAESRQLRLAARTDPKTDLLNMRGWEAAAERELARGERGGSPTGLLMIDLDHFKDINDAWGHPAGDDMLVAFAAALREETRPADVVGRFGGEEFVVLLPGADRYEAVAVAERILKRVRQLRVATTDKRGGSALISGRSASVGVASHPDDAATLATLVQASDAAVYDAKESGRDRVCLAPQ